MAFSPDIPAGFLGEKVIFQVLDIESEIVNKEYVSPGRIQAKSVAPMVVFGTLKESDRMKGNVDQRSRVPLRVNLPRREIKRTIQKRPAGKKRRYQTYKCLRYVKRQNELNYHWY